MEVQFGNVWKTRDSHFWKATIWASLLRFFRDVDNLAFLGDAVTPGKSVAKGEQDGLPLEDVFSKF